LGDEYKYLRGYAARSLGRIRQALGAAVPALARALEDREEDVRHLAAAALGEFGRKVRAAIPALLEAQKDGHRSVRKVAARALVRVDPEGTSQQAGQPPDAPP
jgi:HEAT repeat protein